MDWLRLCCIALLIFSSPCNLYYRRTLGNKLLLLLLLCVISGGALCGQIYAHSADIQVSRRLANLPFILWTVSMCMYIVKTLLS